MASPAVSADILRQHLAYTTWATARLLEACAKLTPEERERDFNTADKSITGTLAHIYAADRVWLDRINNAPARPFITEGDRDFEVVCREWPALLERWNEWAGGLTDACSQEPLSYKDLKGNPWTTPVWQIVLHVVNHDTHHRGQAAGFIRALGHVPPPLDLIAYYRSLK